MQLLAAGKTRDAMKIRKQISKNSKVKSYKELDSVQYCVEVIQAYTQRLAHVKGRE